jgi:hypothetical protein
VIEGFVIVLCCSPFLIAGSTFVGIFIIGYGEHVDKRRAKKKIANAAKKQKAKKQEELNKAASRWRQ